MLDHIGLAVSDYEASKTFYLACLKPLGIEWVVEIDGWTGLGCKGEGGFWFGLDDKVQSPMHIAFRADNRAQVDEFYQLALAAGGTCNGTPGMREVYHPDYYAAFVLDPDGHNVEMVCHRTE